MIQIFSEGYTPIKRIDALILIFLVFFPLLEMKMMVELKHPPSGLERHRL